MINKIIYKSFIFKLLMISFKILIYYALDKIFSGMLICLTMIIYFSFSLIFLLNFAPCFFVSLLRYLMVYDVYLFCEFYLLSLKIFIFVSFKNKFF